MSHVKFKKVPCPVSLFIISMSVFKWPHVACRFWEIAYHVILISLLSMGLMLHVNITKWPSHHVKFRGQGPHWWCGACGHPWLSRLDSCPPHLSYFPGCTQMGLSTVSRLLGKGAIVSRSCGHLSGQTENGESTGSAEWPRIATVTLQSPLTEQTKLVCQSLVR